MNAVVVFGPHFAEDTAQLAIAFHRSGGGRIVSGESAKALPIPEGSFAPCTLTFAHYSLAGEDFESSAERLIGGMTVTLADLMSPKLDWWCDKSTRKVSLTMHWDSCDSSTLRTAAVALEESFVKNGGRISAKGGDETNDEKMVRVLIEGQQRQQEETRRRAENERRKLIIKQRRSQRECFMCGQPLGFFDKLLGRDKHRKCTNFHG